MRFGTSRRQESRSATGWSITTTEDRIPRLTISRRASSMLGFGLCLWQHNVGSQIPPYVCCRTVQRMGSTSLNACRSGFTVQYLRLPSLLAQFVQARAQGTYDRLLKRLTRLSLIIIDDFGLAALNEPERQDLLEAVEERYGAGATIVTSQLPVADWHAYLGGGRIADAILDRLVHNAHRIELASKESMRKNTAA